MEKQQVRLGLVGFGEIGSIVGKGLREAGLSSVRCYDKAAFDGPYSQLIQSRAAAAGVVLVRSQEELAAAADVIVGFTPGSASVESAEAFARVLQRHHVYVDFASATPKVKFAVAANLKAGGASVGDGSILGNPSNGYAMPMLVSGPAAAAAVQALVPWGMRIDVAGDQLGLASGIKILRSVLFKGIEALFDEMILAARGYGMDEAVLASAFKTLDRNTWAEILMNVVPSGAIHARRRAEELEMAAETVENAGIEPIMARAGAARLRWKESLRLKEHFGGVQPKTQQEVFEAIEHLMKAQHSRGGAAIVLGDLNVTRTPDPTAEWQSGPDELQQLSALDSLSVTETAAIEIRKEPVPGHREYPSAPPVSPKILEAFRQVAVATISDNMNRLHGTRALKPFHKSRRLIGTAVTVKTRPGDNLALLKAFKILRPGDILVVDGSGDLNHALVGRLMMCTARAAGVAGFVIDGAIRDVAAFEDEDFPCFARGVTHRGPYKVGPGEINVPIAVDGMIVNPGDVIMGDEDGLIAFCSGIAEELLVRAGQQYQREEETLKAIEAGRTDNAYTSVVAAPANSA